MGTTAQRVRWWWLFAMGWMALGCAHAPAAAPKKSGKAGRQADGLEISLQLGPSASEAARAAWTAYGLGRAVEWSKLRGETRNDSGDDFTIELAGRRAALGVWK